MRHPLTHDEHSKRHIELHRKLDELLADWIDLDSGSLARPVGDLVDWSYSQTINPTEKEGVLQ